MKCDMEAPYMFGALEGSVCKLDKHHEEGRLAQAFLMKQSYQNITDPASALQAGTIFCDLNMPYDVQRNCW